MLAWITILNVKSMLIFVVVLFDNGRKSMFKSAEGPRARTPEISGSVNW
jgi:hypothetical protein